jgi:hypothetical protein
MNKMATEHMPTASEFENPQVRHEPTDINVRGVIGFGIGLFICTTLVALVLIGMFKMLRAGFTPKELKPSPLLVNHQPPQPQETPAEFSEPRLQTDYFQDLKKIREGWDQDLNSYGWVDKNAGIAHIPIEKAMELTLQRGLPSRVPGQQPASVPVTTLEAPTAVAGMPVPQPANAKPATSTAKKARKP